MGYIYKITNQINNKIYIGQTKKTIEERFKVHIKNAKNHINRYLYDAMNCYGFDNFHVSMIEECDNSLLDEREKYWIKFYQSNNKEYGYNMTIGGGGGDTWTNNPHKQETSQKIRQANLGSKRTLEQRKRMSEAQKGVYYIPIDKEEFLQDIKNMMSIEDMCQKYHISRRSLYQRCKDYFNKTPTEIRGDRLKHSNTQYIDIDKQFLIQELKEDKTIKEMSIILKLSPETIRRRIIKIFNCKTTREARNYVKSNY